MDYLWSPWRYQYVTGASESSGCIFCKFPKQNRDRENHIVHRGRLNFIILNRFPYTTGHLMVVPYQHAADFSSVAPEALTEMMALATRVETALRSEYKPDGLNAGFNIGKCAGAGIAGHLHMHLLPRWFADSNFMTVVGETRVLPEDLDTTYDKLKKYF